MIYCDIAHNRQGKEYVMPDSKRDYISPNGVKYIIRTNEIRKIAREEINKIKEKIYGR
jgi:hypothetical protein